MSSLKADLLNVVQKQHDYTWWSTPSVCVPQAVWVYQLCILSVSPRLSTSGGGVSQYTFQGGKLRTSLRGVSGDEQVTSDDHVYLGYP